MNELITIMKNQAVVGSRQVAENFGKKHKTVIRTIERKISSAQKCAQWFYETSYKDASGKTNKEYLMNRDGFSFLVMGFTGAKAAEWQVKYIEEFNRMEKMLIQKQSAEWIECRQAGKLTRRAETDIIKQLIEYAKAQGSEHADKLYIVYSNLANNMAGIKPKIRETLTIENLGNLRMMERIIEKVIRQGMELGKHYKTIYQDCKERLIVFNEVAMIEE